MRVKLRNPDGVTKSVCRLVVLLLSAFAAAADEPSKPLAPTEEKASFHLTDDRLTIELVAAEPEVLSPVAISFDADGRLFVAEMPGINSAGHGRLAFLPAKAGSPAVARREVIS